MKPTTRELATILAALRFWQANYAADSELEEIFADHFAETTALTEDEIEELCNKLNYCLQRLKKTHADVVLPQIKENGQTEHLYMV